MSLRTVCFIGVLVASTTRAEAVDWPNVNWAAIHETPCPEEPLEEIKLPRRPDNRLLLALTLFNCTESDKKVEALKVLESVRGDCDGSWFMVGTENVCPPMSVIEAEEARIGPGARRLFGQSLDGNKLDGASVKTEVLGSDQAELRLTISGLDEAKAAARYRDSEFNRPLAFFRFASVTITDGAGMSWTWKIKLSSKKTPDFAPVCDERTSRCVDLGPFTRAGGAKGAK